jgi:vitamin B12 transporter
MSDPAGKLARALSGAPFVMSASTRSRRAGRLHRRVRPRLVRADPAAACLPERVAPTARRGTASPAPVSPAAVSLAAVSRKTPRVAGHAPRTAHALLLAVVAATAGPLHAQTPAPAAGTSREAASAPSSLDTVTVTATRTPSRIADTVAEVTVVERVDIERASGRTLAELLSRQPGLQWTSNGGLGKTSSVFIRGLESRHTLLLVDGVRLGSATVGTPSWDNLPLDAIERIEIVRGPLSSVYGSDAAGGVIQVFTRRGRPGVHGNATASAGSDRYGQLGGGVAFGQGGFDGAVQFSHTQNRGFSSTNERALFGVFNPDTDGFRQNAGSLRLGWEPAPGWRIDAMALESDGETQYDDGPDVDSRAKLRNGVQSLQASGRLGAGWTTLLRYGRSTDVYDTLATASAFTPLGATRTEQRQLGWENAFDTPVGTALALVERIEQDVSRPGQAYTTSARTIDAVGLGLTGEAARHAWQAAVRHDSNSQFGDQTTGSAGYGFALTPRWRVAGSYGTSFVAPSFNQLYFPGFGNPDLLPEEGRHGELSLRWTSGGQTLRTAWVDNRIRGYIPSGPLPANVPRSRIDGLVMSYEGRWTGLVAGASYEHLDPRNATEGSPDAGNLLPRRARDAFRAQADWLLGRASVGGTLSAFSHRFEDPANRLRLAGFATLDLRADWALTPEWTIGARLNNLADKVYETAYGFNQPGREAFVTLRWAQR